MSARPARGGGALGLFAFEGGKYGVAGLRRWRGRFRNRTASVAECLLEPVALGSAFFEAGEEYACGHGELARSHLLADEIGNASAVGAGIGTGEVHVAVEPALRDSVQSR